MANGIQLNQNSLALAPSGQSRQEQLAQSLKAQSMSGKPVQGGLVEALSRIGTAYFADQNLSQIDQEKDERRQALADTLQRATQATQPGATAQSPNVGPTQMSDSQRMAAILGQNPDTAPMALQMRMQEATQKPQAQSRTISGEQANQLFGTQLDPGAAVTVESGPQGTSIANVQAPQERQQSSVNAQFQAVNKDSGERETLLRTDQGLFRQSVQDGQPVMTPVDSSRYRPVQTSEQGASEDISGLGDTEQRKLRDLEAGTRDYIATTRDAIKLLDENPDVNTFTARGASLINSLQQEATALGRQFGSDFDPDNLNPSNYKDEYEDLGINSNRLRSMVQSLAYQLARTREGGRLSEPDIRSAIRTVGANSADPESLKQTMRDVAERTARRFRINYEVRTDKPFQGDLGLESIAPSPQSGPTRERAGEIEVDEETQRLLEKYQ